LTKLTTSGKPEAYVTICGSFKKFHNTLETTIDIKTKIIIKMNEKIKKIGCDGISHARIIPDTPIDRINKGIILIPIPIAESTAVRAPSSLASGFMVAMYFVLIFDHTNPANNDMITTKLTAMTII
jgi:hypothetical protein